MVKDGKRLVSWAKRKAWTEPIASMKESKRQSREVEAIRKKHEFEGRKAAAERRGWHEGYEKELGKDFLSHEREERGRRGFGFGGFFRALGDPQRSRNAMDVLTRDVPLGGLDLGLGSTTRRSRKAKHKGKRKGKKIVVYVQ